MENQIEKEKQFCRSMFCPECYQAGRPRKNIWYVTYGGISETFRIKYHTRNIDKWNVGFTPHLIRIEAIQMVANTQVVFYKTICLVNDCGITLIFQEKDGRIMASINSKNTKTNRIIDLKSFQDLKSFTDTGLEIETKPLHRH